MLRPLVATLMLRHILTDTIRPLICIRTVRPISYILMLTTRYRPLEITSTCLILIHQLLRTIQLLSLIHHFISAVARVICTAPNLTDDIEAHRVGQVLAQKDPTAAVQHRRIPMLQDGVMLTQVHRRRQGDTPPHHLLGSLADLLRPKIEQLQIPRHLRLYWLMQQRRLVCHLQDR